jgi:hypothetical protein
VQTENPAPSSAHWKLTFASESVKVKVAEVDLVRLSGAAPITGVGMAGLLDWTVRKVPPASASVIATSAATISVVALLVGVS